MAQKEFSKFFVASLKRTAQNISKELKAKKKLEATIEAATNELDLINKKIELFDAPIKLETGGFGVEDLINMVVVNAGTDKEGKPIKKTTFELKYPDTIVPQIEDVQVEEEHCECNNNEDTDTSSLGNTYTPESETSHAVNDANLNND